MSEAVEHIYDHVQRLIAIILRAEFDNPGVTFFTQPEFSQQLGYMKHAAGKTIEPHIHRPLVRSITYTQETLFIRRGKLRVNFFDDAQEYLFSRVLMAGDTILLICGGHGFDVLEDLEMIEVKQGPYAGDEDKVRFRSNSSLEIKA